MVKTKLLETMKSSHIGLAERMQNTISEQIKRKDPKKVKGSMRKGRAGQRIIAKRILLARLLKAHRNSTEQQRLKVSTYLKQI